MSAVLRVRGLGYYTALRYTTGERYFAPTPDDPLVLRYQSGCGTGDDARLLAAAGLKAETEFVL